MPVVILVVVAFALVHVTGAVAWPLTVLLALAYYWRDVRRHPRVRCRVCSGGGGHHSRIGGGRYLRRPFGDCWCCGGRKAHPRLAARLLDPEGHRKIKADIAKGRSEI